MIELNLLPDVKLEYIKAQRSRRLVMSVAVISSVVSIVILVSLVVIGGVQKNYLNNLSKDITKKSADLKAKPDINKILTVQNQLGGLTALHAAKPAVSRTFDYLNQITPSEVSITSFKADFTAQTITLDGGSDTLSGINKFVDTLKYTSYSIDGVDSKKKAFNSVVLSSFGLSSDSSQSSNRPASYTVSFVYDPVIFDIAQKIKLEIPTKTTTRASLDGAPDLFQGTAATPTKASN